MPVIDTSLLVLLLVAAAVVAVGASLTLAPVHDPEALGENPAGAPIWARPLGVLIAVIGAAAGCFLIWPGLDRTTAGVAMGIAVLLFAVGLAYRRRTGLADEAERPGATPRPQLGILLTGSGIAIAAMVLAVGLLGRFA